MRDQGRGEESWRSFLPSFIANNKAHIPAIKCTLDVKEAFSTSASDDVCHLSVCLSAADMSVRRLPVKKCVIRILILIIISATHVGRKERREREREKKKEDDSLTEDATPSLLV